MRVEEEDRKNKLLEALSSPIQRRILTSTMHHPKAITELAKEMDIPLSTSYKFVHELVEAGLMVVDHSTITPEGKRYEVYRSSVREMRVSFEPDRVMVDVILHEDVADKFYRLWSSLRKERF